MFDGAVFQGEIGDGEAGSVWWFSGLLHGWQSFSVIRFSWVLVMLVDMRDTQVEIVSDNNIVAGSFRVMKKHKGAVQHSEMGENGM